MVRMLKMQWCEWMKMKFNYEQWCKYSSYKVILVKILKDMTLYFLWKIFNFPEKQAASLKKKKKSQLLQPSPTSLLYWRMSIGASVKGLWQLWAWYPVWNDEKLSPCWAISLVNWDCWWTAFGEFICGLEDSSSEVLLSYMKKENRRPNDHTFEL